jgi:hypothetical protein
MQKTEQDDPHVSASFSMPQSIKKEMDRRCQRLRLSRTEYLKLLVVQDLDKGEDAPFDISRKPAAESERPGGAAKKR